MLSCTDELLREVAIQAPARGVRIHTHASESPGEIAIVRARYGTGNIDALDKLGLLGAHTCLAHCVHLDDRERAILAARGTHVCHCPSSNLKLASGVADVPELIAAGVSVAIGADGAPCNNNLDGFHELRLAALLHKPKSGPRTLPAPEIVRAATMGGAAALGLADRVGSLELGKRADVIAVDVDGIEAAHRRRRRIRGRRSRTPRRRATSATSRSMARSSCAIARCSRSRSRRSASKRPPPPARCSRSAARWGLATRR